MALTGRLANLKQAPAPDAGISMSRAPVAGPAATQPEEGVSLGASALNFVRNIPTYLLRTAAQPAEFVSKAGTTIGEGLAKVIPQPEFEKKLIRKFVTKEGAQAFQRGLYAPTTLPTQTEPLFAPKPFESGREALGSGLEAGLNVGSVLIGAPGVASLGKTAVTQGVKGLTGRMLAKQLLIDATLGGGFGAATAMQQKEATPSDIGKSAAIGAGIGLLAPPVFGGVTRILSAGGRIASRAAGEGIGRLATKLEEVAAPKAAVTDRFYEQVAQQSPTIVQKAAGMVASGIHGLEALPGKLRTAFLDPFDPVRRLQTQAEEKGIKPPADLGELAHGAQYRGTGAAEVRLDDYLAMRDTNADVWPKVKEYSHYLDDLDRLSRGNTIAGNRTPQQVQDDLTKLVASMSPEEFQKVQAAQKQLQDFLDIELRSAVESGRINEAQYKAIKDAHPNYIPHNVLDFQEEGAAAGSQALGRSLNVASSGIAKAEGSARSIQDIDQAIVDRLVQNSLQNEKNQATKAIIDAGAALGPESGFTPLRTAQNVEDRIAYYQDLKKSRAILDDMRDVARSGEKATKEQTAKIAQLEAVQRQREDELFKELHTLQGEHGNGADLYDQAVRDKFEREATLGRTFSDSDLEDAYQIFRRDAQKNARLMDASVDYEGLRASKTGKSVLQKLTDAASYGRTTENDALTMFRDRYVKERAAPKAQAGFIRRYEAGAKRVQAAEGKVGTASERVQEAVSAHRNLKEDLSSLEAAMSNIEGKRKEIMGNLKQVRDIDAKRVDYAKQGLEKVSFMRDGVREDWLVPQDLGQALKGLDGDGSSAIMQWFNNSLLGKTLAMPAKIIRNVSTQYNPVFALFTNPLRDIQTVQVTAKASPKDLIHGLVTTLTGGKYDEELVRLAKKSGALQGSIYREGLEPSAILAKKLDEGSVFSKTVGRVADLIPAAGEKMEEMTRLAVFKRALADGSSPLEAAKVARDATVDFGKSGNVTRVLNKVIPFLNAHIQGFANLASAIKKNPEHAARILMWTAAYPSALLTAYNSQYESYDAIPDDEKRKYWIVMVGESTGKDKDNQVVKIPHYVKLAKGEAQQAISNTVERLLMIGKQKYPDTTGEFLMKIAGDTSPVTDSSIIPPGIGQALELKANYSYFRNRPIEPEWTKVKGKWFKTSELPPEMRFNDYTSETSKALGKVLGWSPYKLDYVIKQGVVNDILRVPDLLKKQTDLQGFEAAANFPVARSLIGVNNSRYAQKEKQMEAQATMEKNRATIERRTQIEGNQKAPATAGAGLVGRLAK